MSPLHLAVCAVWMLMRPWARGGFREKYFSLSDCGERKCEIVWRTHRDGTPFMTERGCHNPDYMHPETQRILDRGSWENGHVCLQEERVCLQICDTDLCNAKDSSLTTTAITTSTTEEPRHRNSANTFTLVSATFVAPHLALYLCNIISIAWFL